VSWCKYGGALFSTVACARVGKPAAAAAACFSMSALLVSVGVAAPALFAFRFGDLEGSNFGLISGNDRDSEDATLFSNEVVVSTAFTIVAATYMTFAVPWAHEWRVGRAGACGFLGAYFVFALFRGCVETGILFRSPWFEKER
jgi:Ca2+/Na+ antiporter